MSTNVNLDANTIEKQKLAVISRHGPWTAHCIHLGHGIYTFDKPREPQSDSRLRRFLQIAADTARKPMNEIRVLDLACLEGQFGLEFALHGAQVVAVEGRDQNLAKVRFVKEVLSVGNLELVLDDVRNLDKTKHGLFDVVLCLGILYHLDTPDVMNLLKSIYEMCTNVSIIDTHISLSIGDSYTYGNKTYYGQYGLEHHNNATPEQKSVLQWQSLDNVRSFKFTRASLCNILRHVGFTSVYECLNPYEYHYDSWPLAAEGEPVEWGDRITLVAIKGKRQTVLSSPVTEGASEIDRPEQPKYLSSRIGPGIVEQPQLGGRWPRIFRTTLSRLLPESLKRVFRRFTNPRH
jgi:2-polyprenyl-3-methyl-5-hydroxy-6-metoxy-1,4-benzoquinol methylase